MKIIGSKEKSRIAFREIHREALGDDLLDELLKTGEPLWSLLVKNRKTENTRDNLKR
ncbi:MAG: hypothetical protein AB1757_13410 [Acidobacteriota bacterium]